MKCRQCQHELPPNALFCEFCGTKVETESLGDLIDEMNPETGSIAAQLKAAYREQDLRNKVKKTDSSAGGSMSLAEDPFSERSKAVQPDYSYAKPQQSIPTFQNQPAPTINPSVSGRSSGPSKAGSAQSGYSNTFQNTNQPISANSGISQAAAVQPSQPGSSFVLFLIILAIVLVVEGILDALLLML